MLHFVNMSGVPLLLTIAFMTCSVDAQEFVLDSPPGVRTCSEVKQFVKLNGVADVIGTRHPDTWGYTVYRLLVNGFTPDELEKQPNALKFTFEPLEGFGGQQVCLRMTALDLEFQAEKDMSRIDWKHKWPKESQCAQEWDRVVRHIEVHERTHVQDIDDAVRNLNTRISKMQDFRAACASTRAEAIARMWKLLFQAIRTEGKKASEEFEKKREKLDREKVQLDCSKCKSYSFEGLITKLRSEFFSNATKKWVDQGEIQLAASGRICGDPSETDLGYVDVTFNRQTVHFPWGTYRKEVAPGFKKINAGQWIEFLPMTPPQFELTVGEPYQSNILFRWLPPGQKARVPAVVSEEPLGCEESASELRPVSSIPQVRKLLTRFTPQPTTGPLRCE